MNPRYIKEDVTYYLANPDKFEAKEEMYQAMGIDSECMPVGIYDGMTSFTDKSDPKNLDKAQYNVRDRFGFLSEEDDEPDTTDAYDRA